MNPLLIFLLTITLSSCQGMPPTQVHTASEAVSQLDSQKPDPFFAAENVYFELGKIVIPELEIPKILRAARWAQTNPKGYLLLEGYTDNLGSKGYNLAIAEQRLQNVAQQLRQYGVNSRQLRLFPIGDEGVDPRCSSEPCRKLQRKVSIILLLPPGD